MVFASPMEPSKRAFETAGGVARHDTFDLRYGEQYLIDTYLKGRVLDVGCGTGRTTAHIAKTCDVIGIDYAKAMIERARLRHPGLDLRVMDVRALDFPDGTFDAAFFSFNGIDNLYPLEQRLKALAEIKRVLRAGGVFAYVSHTDPIPAPTTLKRLIGRIYTTLFGYKAPYFAHYTGYGFVVNAHLSGETQKKQLRDSGFELLEAFPVKSTEHMYISRAV